MPEHLVAVADVLVREVVDARRGRAWPAAQAVPLAVGHEREIARLEQRRLRAVDLEPALPEVTTWNHMHPGIGGSARPQGAVSSERQ